MENVLAFPGLTRRQLTEAISWEYYKHWGQGYLAGEGITERQGDRSGCLEWVFGRPLTSPPSVVQARLYESTRGQISAVFSYPHGIGIEDHYFWEIYGVGGPDRILPDVERYDTEAEMERRIIELLGEEAH